MSLADFDYELPPEAIAQTPLAERDSARLLVDGGPGRAPSHRRVTDLPELVGPGDVIVVNDSRVLAARLRLRKPTGGAAEVLLLQPHGADGPCWEALVRSSGRIAPGTRLTGTDSDGGLTVDVGAELGEGTRLVRLFEGGQPVTSVPATLERHGEVPLPPYIHEPLGQPERYQTVYADRPGSVAAPTAGLHLTADVLDRCRAAGARVERVDLAVGLGTFRPIAVARVAEHRMHAERYRVAPEVLAACRSAHRVLAVGTTTVRALESAAATGACEGSTDLFIRGEHAFAVVDVLLTNFHVPRSSLLVLVEAFVGPRWRRLYEIALAEGYRFLSFGDAMLLQRDRAER
ncbi:tRNA preQ1(34) S-adenosylmethionine ribosyltransferase-isomerase QueA [soil metagenome]